MSVRHITGCQFWRCHGQHCRLEISGRCWRRRHNRRRLRPLLTVNTFKIRRSIFTTDISDHIQIGQRSGGHQTQAEQQEIHFFHDYWLRGSIQVSAAVCAGNTMGVRVVFATRVGADVLLFRRANLPLTMDL
ncbi:hypothetical protein D3C78_1526310 [compost metagenome]